VNPAKIENGLYKTTQEAAAVVILLMLLNEMSIKKLAGNKK